MSGTTPFPPGFLMPEGSSDRASFWEAFWSQNVTPWDLGGPHPELVRRVADLGKPGRALVPGCGRGHDAVFLATAGWEVTAVDIVSAVEPFIKARLEPFGGRIVIADALAVEDAAGFDLLWDHTFLCAIPPELRPRFGDLARRVVKDGGAVATLVYPSLKDEAAGGPPFRLTTPAVIQALGEGFLLEIDDAVALAGSNDRKGERFTRFRRTSPRERKV